MAPATGSVLLFLGLAGNRVLAGRHFGEGGVSDVLEGMIKSIRGGDKGAVGSALMQVQAQITPDSATAIQNIINPAVDEVRNRIADQVASTQSEIDELLRNLRTETNAGGQAKTVADNIDSIYVQCVQEERESLHQKELLIKRKDETRNHQQRICAERDVAAIVEIDPVPARDVSCDFSEEDSCPNALAEEEQNQEGVTVTVSSTVESKSEAFHNLDAECVRLTELGDELERQIIQQEQAFLTQRTLCERYSTLRMSSQCNFGLKLLYACNHLSGYDELVAKIEGSGAEQSHPDRVAEMHTILTTRCLINRHLLGGQEFEEGSFDACKQEAQHDAHVQEIDLQASTLADINANFDGCSLGRATFSGQSWELPKPGELVSSAYMLVEDYSLPINTNDRVNAIPSCMNFHQDFPQTPGQCGEAPECGERNRDFIGAYDMSAPPGDAFGFFSPPLRFDYIEIDLEHAETVCGGNCKASPQCAGFTWRDGKCYFKKNVQCGTGSDEGKCFTRRSSSTFERE